MRTALAALPGALALLMSAAMAGTFFGFSVGVMPGLGASPGAAAITAMQGINQRIQNPLFLAAFMLAPVAAAAAGAVLWSMDRKTAALLFFASAAVYVAGVFLPTVAVNVPMNDALARLHAPVADAAREWDRYSGRWTAWNHVRTLFGGAATALAAAAFWAWNR
ncbi:hypothetical protein BTM25_54160 [Actinomadura rubteroloni]|uniref:DUF1772 domain-containing protein n=1 Tax=Actinomadura rubteroloni TaxID=1926885 RepID=A0A2P4UBP3_9ACTN|nr:anthrone oxygenase family protein [Actinomadura rubteroloni]POM22466.1 hypothetical protein BTM25_54160 [Actinomadura rubteroloni]